MRYRRNCRNWLCRTYCRSIGRSYADIGGR
uniref:Uncharacterized protein n=1 Tax=Dulem virus 33 TaxID=3145751 RepID=A0AAU8B6X3_9CAUD